MQEELRIGPGRVNLTGDAMYDETQSIIADYLLRYKGVPLAILEAKSETDSAADGMQQASRYARRLSLRFSIASNGSDWILTDNDTGDFETLDAPPSPEDLIARMGVDGRLASLGSRFRCRLSHGSGLAQRRAALPGRRHQ